MKKTLYFITSFILLTLILLQGNKINAAQTKGAGIIDTNGYALNVRSSNSTSSTVLKKLNDGTYITIISQSGSWYYIQYGANSYGYVHSDYIDELSNDYEAITNARVNARWWYSTSSDIRTTLNLGTTVIVIGTINGWSKVIYDGVNVAYIKSEYLSKSQTYQAIDLNVVSFKQYDSRWGNVYIGNSGETFSQIGCATTSISMIESYKKSTTITPLQMYYNLSYTSDGAVYWPSYFKQNTSSTNYLSNIYTELKNGKPVILGCKKANGSQHWIVIDGYSGSNTLSAANFLINDPGSSTRTNLQEFLNVYPYFYKYLTY